MASLTCAHSYSLGHARSPPLPPAFVGHDCWKQRTAVVGACSGGAAVAEANACRGHGAQQHYAQVAVRTAHFVTVTRSHATTLMTLALALLLLLLLGQPQAFPRTYNCCGRCCCCCIIVRGCFPGSERSKGSLPSSSVILVQAVVPVLCQAGALYNCSGHHRHPQWHLRAFALIM